MNVKQVSASKAFKILQENKDSILIDVRTKEEWNSVGVPDVAQEQVMFCSWRLKPEMEINPDFSEFLLENLKFDQKLIFLCRGGSRSNEASQVMEQYGFTDCYNIIDGFEGSNNGSGWKNSNLPWKTNDLA